MDLKQLTDDDLIEAHRLNPKLSSEIAAELRRRMSSPAPAKPQEKRPNELTADELICQYAGSCRALAVPHVESTFVRNNELFEELRQRLSRLDPDRPAAEGWPEGTTVAEVIRVAGRLVDLLKCRDRLAAAPEILAKILINAGSHPTSERVCPSCGSYAWHDGLGGCEACFMEGKPYKFTGTLAAASAGLLEAVQALQEIARYIGADPVTSSPAYVADQVRLIAQYGTDKLRLIGQLLRYDGFIEHVTKDNPSWSDEFEKVRGLKRKWVELQARHDRLQSRVSNFVDEWNG